MTLLSIFEQDIWTNENNNYFSWEYDLKDILKTAQITDKNRSNFPSWQQKWKLVDYNPTSDMIAFKVPGTGVWMHFF